MRKMGVQSVVVETLHPAKGTPGQIEHEVWRDTIALNNYFEQPVITTIIRLTFSAAPLAHPDDLEKKSHQSSFLASAVIFNFRLRDNEWQSYIFSSVVSTLKRPFRFKALDGTEKEGFMPLLNNYVHCAKDFPCQIIIDASAIFNFKIYGTFYCQQNKFTSVCFHASACMAINNLEGRVTELVYPEEVNSILDFNHADRKIISDAELGPKQLEILLDCLGCRYKLMDFVQEHPETNYSHRLYRYLESKCPSLLIFTVYKDFHIVPVLGHTLNSDLWSPEAEMAYSSKIGELKFRPTSAWVDHYIIHDDNFGMYYCLPVDSFLRRKLSLADMPEDVGASEEGCTRDVREEEEKRKPPLDPFIPCYCIAIFQEGISCISPASHCEWGSIKLLEELLGQFPENENIDSYWIKELLFSSRGNPEINPLVARTLLVRKETYSKHLCNEDNDKQSFSEAERTRILTGLPDVFWLTEISLPDIYTANKHKLVDVIFKRDAPMPEIEGDDITMEEKQRRITKWILDNWILMRLPGYLLVNQPAGGQKPFTKISVESHFPLLTDSKEPVILDEW
jgi:hypothetical protein